jgi:hypothetical protein
VQNGGYILLPDIYYDFLQYGPAALLLEWLGNNEEEGKEDHDNGGTSKSTNTDRYIVIDEDMSTKRHENVGRRYYSKSTRGFLLIFIIGEYMGLWNWVQFIDHKVWIPEKWAYGVPFGSFNYRQYRRYDHDDDADDEDVRPLVSSAAAKSRRPLSKEGKKKKYCSSKQDKENENHLHSSHWNMIARSYLEQPVVPSKLLFQSLHAMLHLATISSTCAISSSSSSSKHGKEGYLNLPFYTTVSNEQLEKNEENVPCWYGSLRYCLYHRQASRHVSPSSSSSSSSSSSCLRSSSCFSITTPEKLKVTTTTDPHIATAWVNAYLLPNAHENSSARTPAEDEGEDTIIGIDTETDQNVPLNTSTKYIDILQLSTLDGCVLIYRVVSPDTLFVRLPRSLQYVLESNKFLKVGCACDVDAADLWNAFHVCTQPLVDIQYCVDQLKRDYVTVEVSDPSTLELRLPSHADHKNENEKSSTPMNRSSFFFSFSSSSFSLSSASSGQPLPINEEKIHRPGARRRGLQELVSYVLGNSVCQRRMSAKEGKQIACSSWQTNRYLTKKQIEYAAHDAYACALIYWIAHRSSLFSTHPHTDSSRCHLRKIPTWILLCPPKE